MVGKEPKTTIHSKNQKKGKTVMLCKAKNISGIKRAGLVLGALLLTTSQMLVPAYAQTTLKEGVAFVTGSNLRLREGPSLNDKVLDYAPKNDIVVVIGKEGDWYHVIYNNQEGYMSAQYLRVVTKENAELGFGKVSGDVVNVRSKPTTSSSIVTQVTSKSHPYIIGINEGWYKVVINNKIGYMRSDYLELTEIPYENDDSNIQPIFIRDGKIISPINPSKIPSQPQSNEGQENPSQPEKPAETPVEPPKTTPETPKEDEPIEETQPEAPKEEPKEEAPSASEFGAKVVAEAEKYLGIPYVWGGKHPSTGFDCSGFVYYVFNQCGYPLSRIMSSQYKAGTPVAKEDLQPGDIVFFQGTYTSGMSHTGIYVGNGQFIHSPSTGKSISYANLNSAYYTAHWYGACRITP